MGKRVSAAAFQQIFVCFFVVVEGELVSTNDEVGVLIHDVLIVYNHAQNAKLQNVKKRQGYATVAHTLGQIAGELRHGSGQPACMVPETTSERVIVKW